MTDEQRAAANTSAEPTGRRRLLKFLAIGGVTAAVLPEKWVKPVIDTVIVPAHAQASVVTITGIYSNRSSTVGGAPGNYLERFAGFFISSAHAQTSPPFNAFSECIAFDCSSNPNVAVYFTGASPFFSALQFTQIFPNNVIQSLTIGPYELTNLSASPSALTGTAAYPNSTPENFELLPVPFNPCTIT